MCALLHELIVPVTDLDRIAVECLRCNSITVLGLGLRTKDDGGRLILPAVTACSVCSSDFDPRLKQALRDLTALLSYLGGLTDQRIAFRVAAPAPPKP